MEDDEIISENEQISESLNNVLVNVFINLNIPQYEDTTVNTNVIDDHVLRAIHCVPNKCT